MFGGLTTLVSRLAVKSHSALWGMNEESEGSLEVFSFTQMVKNLS